MAQMMRRDIGDILVQGRVITQEQLNQAREIQGRTGAKLGDILVEQFNVSRFHVLQAEAHQAGMRAVDLTKTPPEPSAEPTPADAEATPTEAEEPAKADDLRDESVQDEATGDAPALSIRETAPPDADAEPEPSSELTASGDRASTPPKDEPRASDPGA